jgi:hypothetical protein
MKTLKVEWAKLRKMSFAEKRWYLWEYYKIHFFAFVIAVFLAGSFINSRFINPRPKTYLYIACIGIDTNYLQIREMEKAFAVIVEEPERYEVYVTDYTLTGERQYDNALQTRFVSMIQLGEIDAIITSRHELEALISAETLIIRKIDSGIFARYQDRFTESDGSVWAISLEGSSFFENLGIRTDDVYLCIVVNTKRLHGTVNALEVLVYGA